MEYKYTSNSYVEYKHTSNSYKCSLLKMPSNNYKLTICVKLYFIVKSPHHLEIDTPLKS